jgi:hypothetical protein
MIISQPSCHVMAGFKQDNQDGELLLPVILNAVKNSNETLHSGP